MWLINYIFIHCTKQKWNNTERKAYTPVGFYKKKNVQQKQSSQIFKQILKVRKTLWQVWLCKDLGEKNMDTP